MKAYMYILECSDGSYYTGSTINLERRLLQHQRGEGANHTKKHLPVKLVYFEEYSRIDVAFYREKQVQGWSRQKKEALINREFNKLPVLARNRTQFPQKVPSASSDTGDEVGELQKVPSKRSGTDSSVVEPVETTIKSTDLLKT
ncbi:MAG: GIY-YIG nuclease family protein [Bacteroidales bacterium]|nr:GIY-YIG nuclease family protein [Bacteroidales bacterium]